MFDSDDLGSVLAGIGIFLLIIIAIAFISFSLYSYFSPKKAEVDRKTFEQSKSFLYGKIQDLSKLYGEFQEDSSKGPVIKNLIQSQFSDFDIVNIDNQILKQFLLEMRGY